MKEYPAGAPHPTGAKGLKRASLRAPTFPPPARDALEQFPVAFQDDVSCYTSATGAAWAPGRVNLIGEHTDYNDGFVLPIAVDRVAAFAGRARSDGIVRLWSTHFQEYAQFSLEGLPLTFEQQSNTLPSWARYVLAVATELTRTGVRLAGFDAVVGGDVPLGGGMSSSAALEVATAQACALFFWRAIELWTSRSNVDANAGGCSLSACRAHCLRSTVWYP